MRLEHLITYTGETRVAQGELRVTVVNTPVGFKALTIEKEARLRIGSDGAAATNLTAESLLMRGGRIEMTDASSLSINAAVDLSSASTAGGTESALIAGGRLALGGTRTILVGNGPADSDATIGSIIVGSASQGVTKTGEGTLTFTGNNTYGGAATITAGRLNINGKQPASPVVVAGGILGGKGTTGPISLQATGAVSPGDRVGRLSTGSITYTSGSFHSLFLEGSDNGQYGQLAVTGTVTLGNAKIRVGHEDEPVAGGELSDHRQRRPRSSHGHVRRPGGRPQRQDWRRAVQHHLSRGRRQRRRHRDARAANLLPRGRCDRRLLRRRRADRESERSGSAGHVDVSCAKAARPSSCSARSPRGRA